MRILFTVLISVFVLANAQAKQSPGPDEFSSPVIQIGVVAEDLEKSLDFYTRIIGMTQTGGFKVEGKKAKNLGLSDGRELDVKVLKLADSPQATEWKLMSFGTPASHPRSKYVHHDTGVQYITIFVKHLDPFIDRIKKAGIDILSEEPSQIGENNYFILIQDPDGTFVELIGPR